MTDTTSSTIPCSNKILIYVIGTLIQALFQKHCCTQFLSCVVVTSSLLYLLHSATPSQSNLLIVSLPGVEFREGGQKWLADNVMSVKVHMTPLQVTKDDTLDCILYKKEVRFSKRDSGCHNL